jgi:hypothetical protein
MVFKPLQRTKGPQQLGRLHCISRYILLYSTYLMADAEFALIATSTYNKA